MDLWWSQKLHLAQKEGQLLEHAKETSSIAAKSRKEGRLGITIFTESIFRAIDSNRAKPAPNPGSGRLTVPVHDLMNPNPLIQSSNTPNPGSAKRVLSIAELDKPVAEAKDIKYL